MSAEANKAIARRYMEAWQAGQAALFEEVLAPDFVDYMIGHRRSREALIQRATSSDSIDRTNIVEDIVAEGDSVAVR